MGVTFGAQIEGWQHWITIGFSYAVGLLLLLGAAVLIAKSYYSEHGTAKRNTASPVNESDPPPHVKKTLALSSASKSGVLGHYAKEADYLVRLLEDVWHHWDNNGEKLVYPLAKTTAIFNNTEGSIRLIKRWHAFCSVYEDHAANMKEDFPEFDTSVAAGTVPEDVEYHIFMQHLKYHATQLKERSAEEWKKAVTLVGL